MRVKVKLFVSMNKHKNKGHLMPQTLGLTLIQTLWTMVDCFYNTAKYFQENMFLKLQISNSKFWVNFTAQDLNAEDQKIIEICYTNYVLLFSKQQTC